MSQRITLSYSIDLEDLSQEVDRLYSSFWDGLCQLSKSDKPEDLLSIDCLKDIEKIKKSLIDVEYKIQDIENIIKSYLQFVASENNVEPQQAQTPDLNNLNAMYEKLTQLRKTIGDDNEVSD